MNTIPFTNRQSIVKVCVVGILGLAVFIGSSGVSLAVCKGTLCNRITCHCFCDTGTNGGVHYGGVLSWDRKLSESCNIVGKGCNKDNREGTVTECSECIPNQSGGRDLCTKFAQDVTGTKYPAYPGVVEPVNPAPKTYPYSKSEMNKRVMPMPRGVEGEPATSAPTEQKDTTPAPK